MNGRQRSKRETQLRERLRILLEAADEVMRELETMHVDREHPAQRRQRLRAVK